jgi:hypothetical protein
MKKNKLLARSSTIQHPNGSKINTPLLVPSFSSKGMYINQDGVSELNKIYSIASEYITESMLVSAFDIYSLVSKIKTSYHANSRLIGIIFLDLYEGLGLHNHSYKEVL